MKSIILLIISLLINFNSYGQFTDEEYKTLRYKYIYTLASPRSYLSPFTISERHLNVHPEGVPDSAQPYILTADLSPSFFMLMGENTNIALSAFTNMKIRILTQPSLPVRTSSYKAGGSIFHSLGGRDDDYEYEEGNDDLQFHYMTYLYSHHSNGQDDCALSGYERDVNGNCVPMRVLRPEEPIFNQTSGNFATDYIELGYNRGNFNQADIAAGGITLLRSLFTGLAYGGEVLNHYYAGLQMHLHNKYFSTIEPELDGRYGLTNIILQYQRIGSTYFNRVPGTPPNKYETERILTKLTINCSDLSKLQYYHKPNYQTVNYNSLANILAYRLNFEVYYHTSPGWLRSPHTSFFIGGGYKGMDDYNIYFENGYFFYRLGLATGINAYKNGWSD